MIAQAGLFITLILLVSLPFTIDVAVLWNSLGNIQIFFLFLALFSVGLEFLLKSLRFHILLNTTAKVVFPLSFLVTLIGFPFAAVTPSRLGDAVKLHLLLQRSSVRVPAAVSMVFLEKLFELLSLFFIVAAALILLSKTQTQLAPLLLPLVIVIFLSLLFLAAFFSNQYIKRTSSRVFSAFFRMFSFLNMRVPSFASSFIRRLSGYTAEFYSSCNEILRQRKSMIPVTILSFLIWTNRVFLVFFLTFAIGVNIDAALFFLLIPLAFVIEILPISIMGLGVREYTFIFLLSFAGIAAEDAVLLSLSVFLIGILFPAIIGYVAAVKVYGTLAPFARQQKSV